MTYRSFWLGAAGALALSGPALAQSTRVGEVVVEANPLGRAAADLATPVIQLTGEELVHRRQATLGDTLAGLPGVNSDTFGAGASRPVIRGQTAPRVKVLSDSSELMDASAVSPDHAVTTEPLLLKSIEVLTGPSALLYGGGAVSGAVNLIDGKIPTAIPARGVEGVAELRAGSNGEERAGVFGMTVGAGQVAAHIEAASRDAEDYDAPWNGSRVAGTASQSTTVSGGASWIGANGYLGAAFTRHRAEYGLPGHEHEYESCHPHGVTLHCGGHDEEEAAHDHGAEDGEDIPFVRLDSERYDLRGEYRDLGMGLERVRLRAGVTRYSHDEIDEGEVSTTFKNQGFDVRLEATHRPIAGWRGVIGVQSIESRFSALGDEAFLPKTDTRTAGVFLFEERSWGDWRVELAGRQDWQEIDAAGRADTSHAPVSVSAAAIWTFTPGYSAALSASRSQRAPSAQELYARGVHLATNTYELGDVGLDVETANTFDLTFRKTQGGTTFTLGVFHQRIDGYVYADTLDQFEDFRLIRYTQRDARFTGIDGEVGRRFSPSFAASIFGDYVKAELAEGGDLPRIPAARLGFHIDADWRGFSGELEYAHTFKQSDIAAYEAVTPGYDMLTATVSRTFDLGDRQIEAYLRGTNLLDDLAYNHASFISRAAPLPGRNVTVGLRAAF